MTPCSRSVAWQPQSARRSLSAERGSLSTPHTDFLQMQRSTHHRGSRPNLLRWQWSLACLVVSCADTAVVDGYGTMYHDPMSSRQPGVGIPYLWTHMSTAALGFCPSPVDPERAVPHSRASPSPAHTVALLAASHCPAIRIRRLKLLLLQLPCIV